MRLHYTAKVCGDIFQPHIDALELELKNCKGNKDRKFR